ALNALGASVAWAQTSPAPGAPPEAPSVQAPPSAAPAPKPDAALLDLARQFVTVNGAEETFKAAAAYGFRAAAGAQGIHLTESQWPRVRSVLDRDLGGAAEIYISTLATYFAAHATADDLNAAIAFYHSPAGVKFSSAAIDASLPVIVFLQSGGR